MIGYTIGTPVMMQLGSYQFGLSTAAYQELMRKSGYRWASQDRFGQYPALQFTGPESETTELSGIIYAEFRGGTGQLDAIRALAAKGLPQRLIDGNGKLLGRWVIESVEETQSTFAAKGYPRKQEFSLSIKSFPESAASIAAAALAVAQKAAASAGVTVPATPAAAKTGLAKFVDGASSAIGSAVSAMTETLDAVKAKAAEIGNAVGPVIAQVQQGVATAKALQTTVANVKGSLANLNSLANIQSAAFGIMNAASAASNAGAFAAGALKDIGITLPPIPSVPGIETAAGVVKDCQVACGKMATAATSIYSEADKLRSTALSLVGK